MFSFCPDSDFSVAGSLVRKACFEDLSVPPSPACIIYLKVCAMSHNPLSKFQWFNFPIIVQNLFCPFSGVERKKLALSNLSSHGTMADCLRSSCVLEKHQFSHSKCKFWQMFSRAMALRMLCLAPLQPPFRGLSGNPYRPCVS